MRAAVLLTALALAGCASEKLALTPSAGVDMSGHWKLNESESDDPQRLLNPNTPPRTSSDPGQGPPSGGGGRGGGRGPGGRGGPGGYGGGPGIISGPTASPGQIAALSEGLRWPGKELDVKQVAGVVAFTSGGRNRVYTPADVDVKPAAGRKKPRGDERDDDDEELGPLRAGANPTAQPPGSPVTPPAAGPSVDAPPPDGGGRGGPGSHAVGGGPGAPGGPGGGGHGREAVITACGWEAKTLVVQVAGRKDDRNGGYEQRYVLSEDGERLLQIVGRSGAHGEGYTLSRVWDRATPDAATAQHSPPPSGETPAVPKPAPPR